MASFLLIFLCLGLGIVFKRTGRFPPATGQALGAFVVHFSLPALTLLQMRRITLDASSIRPLAMAWIVFLLSALIFSQLGRWRNWDRRITGSLILTAGLGNTSFVGFPLLEALFGPTSLATGILIDQPGTFLVAGTLGITVASLYSLPGPGAPSRFAAVSRKLVGFPPVWALGVALLTHDWLYPEAVRITLDRLAQTLVPLALFSVGFQLDLDPRAIRPRLPELGWGLAFKLGLAPLAIALLYRAVPGGTPTENCIILAEAAMAPMITAAVIANEQGLDGELANLMVGIGIPLSLLTVPLWAKMC